MPNRFALAGEMVGHLNQAGKDTAMWVHLCCSIGTYRGIRTEANAMAAWGLNCAICDQRLTKFGIEDTLESYFFPQKPDFPEGGKTFECPNCGYKGTYERTDLVYMH